MPLQHSVFFAMIGLFLATGCNASDPLANIHPLIEDGNSATPAIGESCTGIPNKTCLALHFVAYKNKNSVPTVSPTQAATIIHTMNSLFSTCGIGFQIEKYEQVDPSQYSLSYGSDSQEQVDEIRKVFDTNSNELLAVTTGPWGTAVNAWTNMPGDGLYGAIMEKSIVDYGDGIIYAHEFGHYLGLDHTSDTSNLMDPIIYTDSTTLTDDQCEISKDTIRNYWSAMIR